MIKDCPKRNYFVMQHASPDSSTTEKAASREEEATTTEKEVRTEAMATEATEIVEIEEEAEATVTVEIAATDLVEATTRRETAAAAGAEATRRGTTREEDPEAPTPAEADDLWISSFPSFTCLSPFLR